MWDAERNSRVPGKIDSARKMNHEILQGSPKKRVSLYSKGSLVRFFPDFAPISAFNLKNSVLDDFLQQTSPTTISGNLPVEKSISGNFIFFQFSDKSSILHMIILGIETSGHQTEVALRNADGVFTQRTLSQTGQKHAQALLPEIRELFAECERAPTDCDLVAVSIGPGSFTGLRIGVVFAKTFAYATGCQVVAVPTFAAIAANTPDDISNIHIVADAQRGDLYHAIFERSASGWDQQNTIETLKADDLAARIPPGDCLSGPGLTRYSTLFHQQATLLPEACWHPHAGTVAELGAILAANEEPTDFWSLEPYYIRKSTAEEKWEAKQKQ